MFYIKKQTYIVLLFVLFSFKLNHKFYFSLTEIQANSKSKSLSISAKLFIDDLESVLFKSTHKKVNLAKSVNDSLVMKMVFNYVKINLKMVLNEVPLNPLFLGYEIEGDVIWIYAESSFKNKDFKSIKILNTLLYDFSNDQTNMIIFKWDNKQFTDKLNYPKKEVIFK